MMVAPKVAAPMQMPASSERSHFRSAKATLAILGFTILLIFGSAWYAMLSDVRLGGLAETIEIELTGLPKTAIDSAEVSFFEPGSENVNKRSGKEWLAVRELGEFRWSVRGQWARAIHLTLKADLASAVKSIEIRFNGQKISIPGTELGKSLPRVTPHPFLTNDRSRQVDRFNLKFPNSEWKGDGEPILNWPRNETAILRTLPYLCVPVTLVAILMALGRKKAHWVALGAVQPMVNLKPVDINRRWFWVGMILAASGIATVYLHEPYPFTQDDNFSQFLPVVKRSAKYFFTGHFPTWNPFQLLGAPTTSVGIYILTYPPTYLSYWLAANVLRDANLTIEVFSWLHLAAGYIATYRLLLAVGARNSLALAGTLSFLLSGFFLIAGRSQFTFVPLAVYVPLLLLFLVQLAVNLPGTVKPWRWALACGLTIGALFHAGHAQMWVYTLMFFALSALLLWMGRQLDLWRILWLANACVLGVAFALPLLLVQLQETRTTDPGGYGPGIQMLNLMFPLGSLNRDPLLLGGAYGGHLYYSGSTFALISLAGICCVCSVLLTQRQPTGWLRTSMGGNPWLWVTAIAILFGLGNQGLLWYGMSQLPLFDKFRWPIKFIPFITLFGIMASVVLVERLAKQDWERFRLLVRCIPALTLLLLAVHLPFTRNAWFSFADRPYPQVDGMVRSIIMGDSPPQRLLTNYYYSARSVQPEFFQTQALNFATESGMYAVGGYDRFVMVSDENLAAIQKLMEKPREAAAAYGVKWVLWSEFSARPALGPDPLTWNFEVPLPREKQLLLALSAEGKPVAKQSWGEVYELRDMDPLAFATDSVGNKYSRQVTFDMSGASITASGKSMGEASANASTLTLNVLRRPWLKAYSGTQEIRTFADTWGRLVIPVPNNGSSIRVSYEPPFDRAGLYAFLGSLASLAIGFLLRPKLLTQQLEVHHI
jgi:hypothetical protein